VLREPTPEQKDARRMRRELARPHPLTAGAALCASTGHHRRARVGKLVGKPPV